jgi:hypothetical protein
VHFEENMNGELGSGNIRERDVGGVAGESFGEGENLVGLRSARRI